MDLTDQLRAFVATAETGSFTAAAERLGLSNRLTSKYVAALEDRLGTRLLQRTTRQVGTTAAGERLLEQAPGWLDGLDEMLASVAEGKQGLRGVLRVAAPVNFGEFYATALMARFGDRHPGLTIDLRLSDDHVDLAAQGIDIAFRIGNLGDSALMARRLGRVPMRVAAAPAYVAEHGMPDTPEALIDHACIHDTNNRTVMRWRFGVDGEHDVPIHARLLVNSARAARDLALEGAGIVYGPGFVLDGDIAEGRLVPVLADYEVPTFDLSAVYLGGRMVPRKVRALIDFAVADTAERLG